MIGDKYYTNENKEFGTLVYDKDLKYPIGRVYLDEYDGDWAAEYATTDIGHIGFGTKELAVKEVIAVREQQKARGITP